MQFPLRLVEWLYSMPFMRRPYFLATAVSECPSSVELQAGLVLIEKREGYLKWAHLSCPRCGDHIQLPLAGDKRWSVDVDILRRPTFAPSVWEQASCGAHFFIKKGKLLWCL
jgi:hypothetical protein